MEDKLPGDSWPQAEPVPPGAAPGAAGAGQPRWAQGGHGPGPGSHGAWTHSARTDPAAVWALVLAFLTFFLPVVLPAVLALVLARVAKLRIRRAGGALRGRRLATAATVAGTIGLLFNLAVVALALAGGFQVSWSVGDSGGTTAAPGAVSATTLAPGTGTAPAVGSASVAAPQLGQCIRDPIPNQGLQASSLAVVDCGTPHAAEVFANVQVFASSFPGEGYLDGEASERCREEFQTFVGIPYESSVFFLQKLVPTREGWDQGDHVIDCLLVTGDGSPLTGSMRGAAR